MQEFGDTLHFCHVNDFFMQFERKKQVNRCSASFCILALPNVSRVYINQKWCGFAAYINLFLRGKARVHNTFLRHASGLDARKQQAKMAL